MTESLLRAVPKIELHVHLDGCFDPRELWKHLDSHPELVQCIPIEKKLLYNTSSSTNPFTPRRLVSDCESALDYAALCTCRKRYRKPRDTGERKKHPQDRVRSLENMLICFEFFLPLVYNNFALLEHLAFDFVKRQEAQNVIYTEVRYSPHLLAEDPRKAHEHITKGLRKGCYAANEGGSVCIVNQLLCGIDFQPDWSADVIDMAHEFRQDFPCAVVGIDVAAGESHFSSRSSSHKAHLSMCQKAVQLGIPITLHAGETPGSERHVGAAILDYGARRIGHGYRALTQDDIIELAKSKNVHFENCLTSSVETGAWIKDIWAEHPVCAFKKKGVKFSLSSDDPAVFNTSLTWQWRIAVKKMGWNVDDVYAILKDTIDASFAPENQKRIIRQEIQKYIAEPSSFQNPQFNDRVYYYD